MFYGQYECGDYPGRTFRQHLELNLGTKSWVIILLHSSENRKILFMQFVVPMLTIHFLQEKMNFVHFQKNVEDN